MKLKNKENEMANEAKECSITKAQMDSFMDDLGAVSIKHGICLNQWCAGVSVKKIDETFVGYHADTDGEFHTGMPSVILGKELRYRN